MPPDPEPGIPLALAEHRARTVRDVRYELSFDIPSDVAQPVDGRVRVQLALTDATAPLVLDFAAPADHVRSVSIAGRASAARVANGHIVIPAAELQQGHNSIEISFRAGDAALNRNPEFMYALFVPARAHLTFPCFDQPDIKARYSVDIGAPAGWQTVSNGAERSRDSADGRVRVAFEPTEPLPTYLFSFAAGRFSIETAERQGRTLRMFHRETDAAKVARNRDKVFDLHAAALQWLEQYIGIPYPFGKFDFVAIPSFQFGGMEHPGAVFYNAASILLDESATQNQVLGRASLIAHETAHMWFGDLVTMRWFNDVWMKEVFANFMAAKIVNPSFPEVNHDLRFLAAHYPAAYSVDRTTGTHPIRQPLANLNEAGSLYGPIIYQKAPIVMRQLERLLGEETFREGLREYLRDFAFANATWLDLIRVLDTRTERDLAQWSRTWVEEAGRPTVRTELTTDRDGSIERLALVQSDPQEGRSLLWTQQAEVLIGTEQRVHRVPVELSSATTQVAVPAGVTRPSFVLPSGGGIAYGRFELDPATRDFLVANVHTLADPVARGAAWIALWDELLDGRLAAAELVAAARRTLTSDTTEQNIQLVAGYVREAFWRFLADGERAAVAGQLEATLRNGIARATSSSMKATFFGAFRSIVTTAEGMAFLERVWSRSEQIEGLLLAEPDEAAMALDLAVRGIPNAQTVLEEQRKRFQNPDRKARFEFVMPAVSPDEAVRGAFFRQLADLSNRRREPWVEEGLQYLHHPLRARESRQYLRPSLELLEEIRRTGDIFFPTRWTAATLSGHNSREAAAIVRQFLDERPDYPVQLRRVILQSADDLFRAADRSAPDSTNRPAQ